MTKPHAPIGAPPGHFLFGNNAMINRASLFPLLCNDCRKFNIQRVENVRWRVHVLNTHIKYTDDVRVEPF